MSRKSFQDNSAAFYVFPPIYIPRQYYYVKKIKNILHFKEILIKYC